MRSNCLLPGALLPGLLATLLAADHMGFSSALIVDGSLNTLDSWSYVSRFCFLPTPTGTSEGDKKDYGRVQFTVSYAPHMKPVLLAYGVTQDGFDAWEKIYGSKKSSAELHEAAEVRIKLYETNRYVTSINTNSVWRIETKGELYWSISGGARWIFMAIDNVDCDNCPMLWTQGDCTCQCSNPPFCQGPLDLDYKFVFTNGKELSTMHFSADELNILPTDTAFLIIQIAVVATAMYIRQSLVRKKKYHHTVKMLVKSAVLQLCAIALSQIHYSLYARDGVGSRFRGIYWMLNVSSLITCFAEMYLILLLIVLAKGWTVVRRKLSSRGRIKIAAYLSFYLVTSLLMQFWIEFGFDDAAVAYVYESPPGIGMVILRIIAAIWFLYAACTTKNNPQYESKRCFYAAFTGIFAAWFITVPLIALVGGALSDSKRAFFMFAWERVLMAFAHIALLVLYNPNTRCNRAFPFHANTSQMLGIIKHTSTRSGSLTSGAAAGQLVTAGESQAALLGGDENGGSGAPPSSK